LKNMKKNWNHRISVACCFRHSLLINQAFRRFSMLECRLA
jgi:hypothetical protein